MPKRKPKTVCVRMLPSQVKTLDTLAALRGMTPSALIRQLLAEEAVRRVEDLRQRERILEACRRNFHGD